jgi:hypothetical protein
MKEKPGGKALWALAGALAMGVLFIGAALLFLALPAGRAKGQPPAARLPPLPASLTQYEKSMSFTLPEGLGATDLAVGSMGLYVTCAAGYQVWTFDGVGAPGGSAPAVVQSVKTSIRPWGLAVDADGTVYLGMDRRVEVHAADGKLVREWAELGRDARIQAVAVDAEYVYASDGQEKTVYQFTKQGRMVRRIGDKNDREGIPGFVVPGIHFDLLSTGSSGGRHLIVSNPGRHAVELFSPDGSLQYMWTRTGDDWEGFTGCCNPGSIAFLPAGPASATDLLFTAEKGIPRVKAYTLDGRLESVIEGPEDFLPNVVGIEIAVARDGRVLILDPDRQEVRVFTRTRTAG